MNNHLLFKMAVSGIKKNKRTVLPYILVGAITVLIFYTLQAIACSKYVMNDGVAAFKGANYIVVFLKIGSVAVSLFALVFLFYGNQFVMKGRRKELGLYGVLGLSKKNMTFIMFVESFIQAFISIGIGVVVGAFLNKLMILLLYKLIHRPYVRGLEFQVKALVVTVLLFSCIYAACFIYNLISVRIGNPIELLRSENIGEKEPKVNVIFFIIGIFTIFVGYYKALNASTIFESLESLVIAIIMVSIGTYMLFISGSIFVLKMLKKNKKYYFRTKHFISVSNLMFRMKHNAAGLASICILSTAVILLMVCSGTLMALGEQNINAMYLYDMTIIGNRTSDISDKEYEDAVNYAIDKSGLELKDLTSRKYVESLCGVDLDSHKLVAIKKKSLDLSKTRTVYFMTLDDYNKAVGTSITLNHGEILRYSSAENVEVNSTLNIYGKELKVKDTIEKDSLKCGFDPQMSLFDKEIVVLQNQNSIEELVDKETLFYYPTMYIGLNENKKIDTMQLESFKKALEEKIGDVRVNCKDEERKEFYSIYGGTFFVGIFLASLFLIATVMIIYYKQMSEGMEDQKRFKILSNAGLTEKEAKKTIKSQVMIMFFLPVVTAILHMVVASKILRLFISMLVIVDSFTFNMSILAVCLVFLTVYAVVYKKTSKQYYQIVYGSDAA